MAELTREELTRRGLEAFKNSKPWGSQSVDTIKTAENKTADTTGTAFESQAQAKPWINTEQDKRLDEVSKGTEHAVPYWAKNLKDPLTTSYYEKVDTLKAEYPVFAKNIDAVRAKGYSDAQIRAYLSRQEFINRAYYSHDTIEKMYGRTAESWNDYWEGMNAQKDAAYVKILKHKMPEERIRDIVKTARINSMSPALLFRSPALLKKAEEMAGERLGTLEHLIASIGNAISNTNSISAGSEKFIAESSQQEIKRLEKILSEGSELEPENGALVPIGARAIENEDERREFVRNNIQQRIETLKKQVQTWSDWQKTDEADTQRWYTNIRPTDSAIGAFLYSAIENSGTTILSAIRSGIGWGLGGVAGGMLASAFNTWDESTGEAGRVLIEGLKRGMSDTEAYNAARQDYYGNLAYLGISNFGGDVFRFGLGHVRGLLAQHGKNAIVSRLDKWLGYASGLPDKLAGKITGDKIFHKVLRGAVKYGLPEVLEAIPEGGEEVFQDWYSAYVLGDKVKAEELWSSFWGGVGQSLVYSLAGKGTGKVIDKITGADARKKAQEDVARVIQEVQKTVQEGNKLEAGLNDGTIKADDIVAEDPVVFLPRASLTEQVREQLGLNDETTEVLSDKDELTTSEAAQIDAESTGEVQEVQAGNNQAENQQDDEVAVRQSVWDEFKKEHPEEAAALEPNLRTGVKGVTAAERLAQIEEFLNLDMPTVEAQQVRNIVSQVQNDWKNLRGEVGFNISDEVIEAESTIYGHYLLSRYAEYGFTSPGEFHEFKLQNGDNPVENVLNQLMHHGTRHNLGGRFDLMKIGTGEGNQAYGWGIYLAENRAVSESYRTAGTPQYGKLVVNMSDGTQYDNTNNWLNVPDTITRQVFHNILTQFHNSFRPGSLTLARIKNTLEKAYKREVKDAKRYLKDSGYDKAQIQEKLKPFEARLEVLNKITNVSYEKVADPGNLYTVEGPENDVLLDWDVPLSEQPESVKKAIKKVTSSLKRMRMYDDILQEMTDNGATGADFYSGLTKAMWRKDSMRRRGYSKRGDQAASELLNKYGIPGLRYWDRTSRKKSEGTHNFVVWNTDLLKIMGVEGTAAELETYNQDVNSEANLAADEERNTRRGYIDVSDPKKVVLGLTKNADASTFLHEIWHMALADLLRYGNRAAASEQVKADRKTAMEWLGITKADFDNPERMRTAQEDWARAGEAYFMTGKAPTKQLQGVFQRIRAWMLEIYDGIKASLKLNRELTDEIREVFDRMLALEEDITEANAAESNITVGQSRHEAEQISARVRELEAEIRANGDNIPEETAAAEAADYQAVFFQDVEELKTQAEAVRSRYEGTEEWLKAPNGEQSNLDERTWCLVRTPNFKRWFGHWNYDAKTKIEVTDINNKGLTVDFKDTKSLKKWLENAYAGKTVEIEDDGVIVGFSKKKLNDSLKRRGEVQREAYAVLEELIKKSHYYDFEENDGQDKHKNLIGQDIYYSALKVGNDYYSVKFKFDVLRENLSSTYKDHRITEIKISPLVYHTQTQANSSATHARTGDKLFYTLSDLAGGVKPQQASKVVDENGEPLVVYHGTDYGGFSVFNTSQEGIFFSNYDRASWYTHDYDPKIIRRPPDFKSWEDVKDYAREHDIDFEEADKNEYGDGKFFINGEITWDLNEASDILFKAKSENGNIGNIYACFLNIKKPNVIHAKGKSAYDIEQIRKNAKQDGVIVYDIVDGTYDEGSQFEATNYIVFNPEQIKAIDNVGTFNPGNSDIYYQDALEVNGENESTPEWLDVEAARDVEGWLKEWGAYEVRRDEYQNLREGIRLIKELGGLRFQDFVNVLGRELAVDLRSQWSGLFRNIQGKIKLPLDQLMQSLEAEGLRFEYADDFINWLENAAKQQPKRPLPLVEINEKTLDALIHSIGFDGAKDYIDQRRRYLKALQRKIQAEYDKDKSNAQVRADLETTYKEQREISEQLKRFDWAFAESEADIPEWLADTSWLDGDNKNRTEVKKRRTQPENLTLSEAFKKGYGLAEKYSREAYKAGFKAGREQQHTKDAERIANLKDTQKERIAALKAKYKQLQALEKAKKALNAFIDKMVNDVKEAINDKKVIWHVQQEIKKELEKIDLKHRSKQALERQHDVEFLLESIGKTPETLTQEDMDTLGITAKDLKNLGKSSIDEMTIAELYKLHEKIQELREQGRRELEVKNLLNKERINKMREELWRPLLEKLAKRPRGAVKSRKDLDKIYAKGIKGAAQRALDYINTRTLGANRFFDWLDGGKGAYTGAWVRYFVDAINDAQNEKLRHIFERREWIEARMQELGLKAADLAQERKVDIPDISSEPWTVDRLMSIYAGMKNEKSRAAILYGNFAQAKSFVDLTQAKTEEEQQELIYDKANEWAAKCVQALTNKEKAFADAIIEEYEMHFERINNALIDVYNRGMSHEENYTPMRRLEVNAYGNISTPDTAQTMLDNSYTVQAGGGSKSGDLGHVDRGFAKERIKNLPAKAQASIDLGLFNIWNTQMEAQEHAAAFVRPVQDMRKILTGRNKNKQEMTIQKAVKLVHGKDAWAFIRNYFNIAAQDQTLLAHDVLDGVFGWLAKNASRAYLCANAGTALKQTTSFPRFLPYCGLTHMLKAIGEFAADHKKFINECYALDPQLKARSGNVILQSMRASAELGKYGEILDMGMKPIQWMDKGASIIGWKAVYDANIAKGKSQQEAVRAAQRAVALTQQTIHVKDAPLLWQQGGLVRLAMIFSSDTAQTFGISIYDLAASIRAGNAPKFLSTILSVTLAATMMGLLTKGGPDDDDWDSLSGWLEFMGSSLARQTVETIPLLGKGLLNLWDSKGYSTGEQSAYLAPFARIISAGSKLWDTKSDNNEDAFFNLMEAGALFAPFPVTAVRRLWRVGGDVARGEFWDGFKHSIGLRREFKKARRRLSR